MSGGPAFDASNQVIRFNSRSTQFGTPQPGWDSFPAGTAAALELNVQYKPSTPDDGMPTQNILDRTVQLTQLVAQGRVNCEMCDSFFVDPETGWAGYA